MHSGRAVPAEIRMLAPGKVSAVLSRARGPQTPAPSPCTPSPACRGTLSERKATCRGCSPFQDHLVLETIPDFRIILGLENAKRSHMLPGFTETEVDEFCNTCLT